jgi:molybdate transport system permease protein
VISENRINPPHRSWWLLVLLSVPLLGLLVVPPVVLIARASPGMLAKYLGSQAVAQAMVLSLWTSATSLLVVIVFGTPLAYLLGRGRFRGRGLLEVLIEWPIVLPPAAAGIALLMTLGRRGVVGQWLEKAGFSIPFTSVAVILAQTFVSAPYFIKAASVGLSNISQDILDSAALDGASAWQRFLEISAPLAIRSLIVGAALTWSRALGEFGATIIFAGNLQGKTQTMPLAVYMGFEIDIGQAVALAAVLLGISFCLLVGIRLAWKQ